MITHRGPTNERRKSWEKQSQDYTLTQDSSIEEGRIHSTPTGVLLTSLNLTPRTSMTDWDSTVDTDGSNDSATPIQTLPEKPNTTVSPSAPMFLVDKIRHKKSTHKASEWFLEGTDKEILIIRDSNVSRVNRFDCSYPNGRFSLVRKLPTST